MTERRSCLLYQEVKRLWRNRHCNQLSGSLCPDKANYPVGWDGRRERKDVLSDGRCDYRGEANFLGGLLCAGLWNAGSRRCKIFHADFLCYHVAIPGQPLRPFSAPVSLWADGSVDRHVCRLGSSFFNFHNQIPQRKMGRASCAGINDF